MEEGEKIMIEILNKLINIVVGSSDIDYLLTFSNLKENYCIFINSVNEQYSSLDIFTWDKAVVNFDYRLFFPWIFSNPNVIISFIFYIMVSFGIIYFFMVVPFRLIKQLLPKSVRTKKGANKA
ncbi:MAG TPA: hypothetical protein GX745_03485 [Clostridiales bacterium]|nr:hypothetical protein [Clostridiales bacterium]